MKLIHVFSAVSAFMIVLAAAQVIPATYTSIRCGNYLIDVGTTRHDVLSKCGEPADVQESLVERTEPRYLWYYRDRLRPEHDLQGYTTAPDDWNIPEKITVQREQFIYDWGSARLIYILTFEDGILLQIKTGGYGSR